MTRLRYWLYLCDEYATRLLIGEDVIARGAAEHRATPGGDDPMLPASTWHDA